MKYISRNVNELIMLVFLSGLLIGFWSWLRNLPICIGAIGLYMILLVLHVIVGIFEVRKYG